MQARCGDRSGDRFLGNGSARAELFRHGVLAFARFFEPLLGKSLSGLLSAGLEFGRLSACILTTFGIEPNANERAN
jgi:hypothetical protein